MLTVRAQFFNLQLLVESSFEMTTAEHYEFGDVQGTVQWFNLWDGSILVVLISTEVLSFTSPRQAISG